MTSHPHDQRAWQRPGDASPRSGSARLVDPEDDLPSADYSGDFETTAIPSYRKGDHGVSSSAFGLIGEPESLPYVEPSTGRHAMVDEMERDDFADDRVRTAGRRGTQDLGLLVLRLGIGGVLIARGLQKAFGIWGGQGFDGFATSLSDLGFKHAGILTYAAAGTQLAAGVLLVLGLFTPLAAAAALAYLTNGVIAVVAAQHNAGRYSFFLPDGIEYRAVLMVALAAIILAGPGRIGFDAGRGWARRPLWGSVAALLLGVGLGVGVWALLNGTNPLA